MNGKTAHLAIGFDCGGVWKPNQTWFSSCGTAASQLPLGFARSACCFRSCAFSGIPTLACAAEPSPHKEHHQKGKGAHLLGLFGAPALFLDPEIPPILTVPLFYLRWGKDSEGIASKTGGGTVSEKDQPIIHCKLRKTKPNFNRKESRPNQISTVSKKDQAHFS